MTDENLTAYIATLDKLPCGCTTNRVRLCPVALALREAVGLAWKEYRNGRMPSAEYYAVGGLFLAHFENSHAPEPVAEAERVGMEVGAGVAWVVGK